MAEWVFFRVAVKRLWDLALGVLFREICGICVSLWSEAALKRLWDLTSGVQFREIREICVRLWSEAALKRLWDLTPGVQFREICGICVSIAPILAGFVWGGGDRNRMRLTSTANLTQK